MNMKKAVFSLLFISMTALLSSQEFDASLFRYSMEENMRLANNNPHATLPHRIFYKAPSEGPDAEWFDAVKQGNTEKMVSMIQGGQDINVKDEASLGENALFWASFLGYLDMVEILMDNAADFIVNSRADGKDALKAVVLGGQVEVFNYLLPTALEYDPDAIHVEEADGETFLMVAVWNNRKELVSRLLELGVDPNQMAAGKNRSTALSYARYRGYADLEQILLDAGAVR